MFSWKIISVGAIFPGTEHGKHPESQSIVNLRWFCFLSNILEKQHNALVMQGRKQNKKVCPAHHLQIVILLGANCTPNPAIYYHNKATHLNLNYTIDNSKSLRPTISRAHALKIHSTKLDPPGSWEKGRELISYGEACPHKFDNFLVNHSERCFIFTESSLFLEK